MMKSITRKFLVKELPDLANIARDTYQRYYLYNNRSIVIRIQRINDDYELERKANESDLVRMGETIKITKDEFDELKKAAKQYIERDSYHIQDNPDIVIRVYHGDYEGLKRIEVKFHSVEESQTFIPLDWFGKEITGTPLAQDGYLLQLTKEEFLKLFELTKFELF